MLKTKRQILATTAVIAGIVMTAGTAAVELATAPATAPHSAKVAPWQPPAAPPTATGAPPVEDGEST